MLKKELRFQAKLDTSEFDNSVKQMQNRLKEVYTGADTMRQAISTQQRGAGMGLAAPATPAQQRQADDQSKRSLQETDRFIKEQLRTQQRLSDIIDKKSKQQDELNKKLKEENLTLEQKKKLEEDLQRVARQRQRLEGTQAGVTGSVEDRMRQRESMINNMRLDQRLEARLTDLKGAQGFQGKAEALGKYGREAALPFGIGSAIGAGAVSAGQQLTEYAGMMGYRTTGNQAATVAQNQGFANLITNRTAFEAPFKSQRKEAQEMGDRKKLVEGVKDTLAAIGIVGGVALATVATGGLALAGAGVAAGALGVGGGNLLGRITGERTSQVEAEAARVREETYQNLKALSPVAKAATEDYEQNYAQYREFQRTFGLSDKETYGKGGVLASAMGGQFTREQAMGAMTGILGAGGSTRAARGLGFEANQMAKDLNLTNAAQVMGTLSGRLGGAAETKNATISIMAEAVKLGLDKSEFAEEQRRFVQTSAEVVARSGARTEAGAEEVARRFGQFAQGADTMAGIQGARTAYDIQQQLTKQSTGFRGALQAAGFTSDPALKKLSRDQMYSLTNMSEEQVMAGGFEVRAMAQAAGLTLDEFKQKALGVKRQSVTMRASTDTQRDELREMVKKGGYKSLSEAMKNPEIEAKLGRFASSLTTDIGAIAGADEETKRAVAAGQLGLEGGISEEEAKKQIAAKKTGRVADETTSAVATSQALNLEFLDSMRGRFSEAAESSKEISKNLAEAARRFEEAMGKAKTTGERGAAVKQLEEETARAQQGLPLTQPKAGTGKR
jgi:hypothetical protein